MALLYSKYLRPTIQLCLIGYLLFVSNSLIIAQSEALETERLLLLKEIKQTSQLLKSTKKNKETAIDEYYVLQRQIEQRTKLIQTLQQEISASAIKMEHSALLVDSLELEIDKLKAEYAAMIQQAFRSKMGSNDLVFLLSAKSFNQALRRWRYIQQYDDYRKRQLHLIIETQTALKTQIRQLETNKYEQEQLLASEEAQNKSIQQALSYKGNLLNQLKKDEQYISGLLRQQKMAHERLNEAVESVIVANISQKAEEREEAAVSVKEKENVVKKELSADLSYQFARARGTMSWPVQNGIITRYFGNQAHPIHKKIMINNNGIDIQARSDKTVYALFEGIVTGIQIVPGYRNTLILQHGEYYSVYSNLEVVKVKKGDIVLAQQAIGEVGVNKQKDYPELHLEIWKGKNRLNPFGWLKRI